MTLLLEWILVLVMLFGGWGSVPTDVRVEGEGGTASARGHAPSTAPSELSELVSRTWPAHRHAEVLAVVECESGWDPTEIGSQGEIGLLQIHPRWWPDLAAEYDLTDPEQNLRAGRIAFLRWQAAFNESGWNAWACGNVVTGEN